LDSANIDRQDNNQKPVMSADTDACKIEKEQSKNTTDSLYIEHFLRALNECTQHL
jgi:hypothetical protein